MIDDDTFKNFSNYLLDLGFLSKSTYNEFSKKYEEIRQRKMYSSNIELTSSTQSGINKNNITDTVVEYYKSLQDERKKLLAINVFDIFFKRSIKKNMKESENDEIQLSNLDDIIMEKEENNFGNNKDNTNKIIDHVESFNIPGIKNNKPQKEEKNDGCSFSNFINRKKQPKNKVPKNNFSYLRPKRAEENDKKAELNEQCTFQPNADKIKNKPLSKDQQDQLIKRLFTTNKEEKRKKLIEDIISEQDKENKFQPNFNKGKSNLSRKNFDDRLKHFEEVRKEQKKNRIREEEKQFKEKFPFAPKRRNSTSRRNYSASKYNNNIYQKLYEDNARKKERQKNNLKQIMNEIKDRANHPITTHNNIDYIKRMKFERYERLKMYPGNMYNKNYMNNINNRNNRNNRSDINSMKDKEVKKSYEFNRIEELYKEYKKIKEEMNSRKKTENNYNEQNSNDDNVNILNNIDNNEIDDENYDYNNNMQNNYMYGDNNNNRIDDDKYFNDGNIDNNNSKEANIDNNNIEENDDFDNNSKEEKEENIDNNNEANNYNNSIECNIEDINNKNNKSNNNEDNYEEGEEVNNYDDNEQENGGDNENSINQNYEYADKASVKNEDEDENDNEMQNN